MSQQCEVCGGWLLEKEVELIRDFFETHAFKIDEFPICSTCLRKDYETIWKKFITWLIGTKHRNKSKVTSSIP